LPLLAVRTTSPASIIYRRNVSHPSLIPESPAFAKVPSFIGVGMSGKGVRRDKAALSSGYVFAYWIPFPDDRVKLMLVPWALTAGGFAVRWAYKGFSGN
jgi:hypothetical protein